MGRTAGMLWAVVVALGTGCGSTDVTWSEWRGDPCEDPAAVPDSEHLLHAAYVHVYADPTASDPGHPALVLSSYPETCDGLSCRSGWEVSVSGLPWETGTFRDLAASCERWSGDSTCSGGETGCKPLDPGQSLDVQVVSVTDTCIAGEIRSQEEDWVPPGDGYFVAHACE